jgi:pimeloyl-ACP methyl ester carboxylesterase
MQVVLRPIAPGELDHELLWLGVSLGSLAAAALWFALRLPWPICVFHAITGHPCATCGATRSAIAFFHADFLSAWKWNPLALVFFCGVTAFDVYAFAVLVTRSPRLRITHLARSEKNFVRIALIAALALNWIYLLIANPVL